MIKPTVGRVVWVIRPGATFDIHQPEAALITYVHSDRLVNVGGFGHGGSPFFATSVPLLQDDDAKPEGKFAMWMPYQKGQAARHEAAEASTVAAP